MPKNINTDIFLTMQNSDEQQHLTFKSVYMTK